MEPPDVWVGYAGPAAEGGGELVIVRCRSWRKYAAFSSLRVEACWRIACAYASAVAFAADMLGAKETTDEARASGGSGGLLGIGFGEVLLVVTAE